MSTVDTQQDGTQEQQQNPPAPAPTQPPPAPPQQQHSSGPSFGSELLNAVNALPEKLVNAMREAAPKAPPAPKQTPTDTKSTEDKDKSTKDSNENPGPQGVHKGRHERFLDWWNK